jgi:hypothetical protein
MSLNILKILVHSASTGYGLCKIVNRLMIPYFVIINTLLKLLYDVLFTVQGLQYKEVTGSLRKVHNEKLCNSCCPSNIIRMMKLMRKRWAQNADMGENWNSCKISVRGPECTRSHG